MSAVKIKTLEKNLLFQTKQANAYRISRNKAKTVREQRAWQTIIDLADNAKIEIRNEIRKLKGIGLKAPATRGLRKLCAKTFNVTGLRKKNGTIKKGYRNKKGGKIVKVSTLKK
jgi:hypothetical protein